MFGTRDNGGEERNSKAQQDAQLSPRPQGETFIQIHKMHQNLFLSAPVDTARRAAQG